MGAMQSTGGPLASPGGGGGCPRGGGGATQSEKGYQLRSDLLGAVAVANRRWLQKGGLSSPYIPPEGSCHSLNS